MVLVDGFPRNMDNALCWDRLLPALPLAAAEVLVLEAAEPLLLARLERRGQTSGRSDDNPASVTRRLETFRRETLPVLDLPGLRVRRLAADGSEEEVYQCFRAALLKMAL